MEISYDFYRRDESKKYWTEIVYASTPIGIWKKSSAYWKKIRIPDRFLIICL